MQKHGYRLDSSKDLDPLIERVGDARFVLLGEATHGTSEYYQWRTEISKRLIKEKGFSIIAIEDDWSACYKVNRYIKGSKRFGKKAYDILNVFDRWPTWMWSNQETVELVEWLKNYNDKFGKKNKVGFYGVDVYSLWESLNIVIDYLKKTDPKTLKSAQKALECFELYEHAARDYASSSMMVPSSCQDEVIDMLVKILRKANDYKKKGEEAYFNVEQNAYVVRDAENYYRSMVKGNVESWNLRDKYMVESLERLMNHYGEKTKAIVWAHNSHVGDARASDMVQEGMINMGQLIRDRHREKNTVIVGFGSFQGTVISSSHWDGPIKRMPVFPAEEGSWEDLFHRAGIKNKMFIFSPPDGEQMFYDKRNLRGIGVVYDPYNDITNYVPTVLASRFDVFIYLDKTHALHPLHLVQEFDQDLPNTFPQGV